MRPALLRMHFLEPAWSEDRHASGHASILVVIGEDAALGKRSKSVIVLALQRHVTRTNGEIRVRGSALANPGKGQQPWVMLFGVRPLYMRSSRIHLALGVEHSCTQRNKKQKPAIQPPFEHVTSEQPACNQKEKQIDQVQVAHGLKRPQTLKAGNKHDNEACNRLEDAIREQTFNQHA